jgi:hypothetical protein
VIESGCKTPSPPGGYQVAKDITFTWKTGLPDVMATLYVWDAIRQVVDEKRETLQEENGGEYVNDPEALLALLDDETAQRIKERRNNSS